MTLDDAQMLMTLDDAQMLSSGFLRVQPDYMRTKAYEVVTRRYVHINTIREIEVVMVGPQSLPKQEVRAYTYDSDGRYLLVASDD